MNIFLLEQFDILIFLNGFLLLIFSFFLFLFATLSPLKKEEEHALLTIALMSLVYAIRKWFVISIANIENNALSDGIRIFLLIATYTPAIILNIKYNLFLFKNKIITIPISIILFSTIFFLLESTTKLIQIEISIILSLGLPFALNTLFYTKNQVKSVSNMFPLFILIFLTNIIDIPHMYFYPSTYLPDLVINFVNIFIINSFISLLFLFILISLIFVKITQLQLYYQVKKNLYASFLFFFFIILLSVFLTNKIAEKAKFIEKKFLLARLDYLRYHYMQISKMVDKISENIIKSELTNFNDLNDTDRLNHTLQTNLKIYDNIVIFISDKNGQIIASSNYKTSTLIKKNISTYNFFKQGIKGEIFHIVGVDPLSDTPAIFHVRPIFFNRQLEGLLIAQYPIDSYIKNFRTTNMIMIMTEDGIILSTNRHEHILRSIWTNPKSDKDLEFKKYHKNPLYNGPRPKEDGEIFIFNKLSYYTSLKLDPTNMLTGVFIEFTNKNAARIMILLVLMILIFIYCFFIITNIKNKSNIQKTKDSEKFLFDILQLLPDATFVVDTNKKIIFWNKALERLTKIKSENAIGQGELFYRNIFYKKDRPLLIDLVFEKSSQIELYYEDYFQKDEEISATIAIQTEDNNTIHLWMAAILLKDSHQNILGAIEVIRDISVSKNLEAKQKHIERQMLKSEKLASIGTITSAVAHEINNPLLVISAINLLIKEHIFGNNFPKSLPSIDYNHLLEMFDKNEQSIQKIKDIAQELKGRSRDSGDELEKHDLIHLINNAIKLHQLLNDKNHTKIVTQILLKTSFVKINKGKMEQVITNLLNNAQDAIIELKSEKMGEIIISLTEDNYNYILSISDNGTGIDPTQFRAIFEPFYTTKPVGKGTGLGLSIVKNIIESFGGKIDLESKKNVGTTFIITLKKYNDQEVDEYTDRL